MAFNASTPAIEKAIEKLEKEVLEPTDFDRKRHDETVVEIQELNGTLHKTWTILYPDDMVDQLPELRSLILKMIQFEVNKILEYAQILHFENDMCAICLEEKAQNPVYCIQCLKIVSCKGCTDDLVRHSGHFVKCPRCQRKSPTELPLFYCAPP
ncbi:unnamed protein product [Bursaphelenchus xylophilus]|uniref:(pine wood nematode) hypothetical protein n=1 Tax=Bursaphelenchus xylophilus TaxID=6326 RepID=A0A1I7S825_BURXY|nr:unnamed protein product [Bursaphelenchus xylophilus]CAG9080661.1 unnamed protein product [Bursaphelenchus xylophilus]